MHSNIWSINGDKLIVNGEEVLSGAKSLHNGESLGNGYILSLCSDEKLSQISYSLGNLNDVEKIMCCYRINPFFMSVAFGEDISFVKEETMCLLIKKHDNRYLLLLPIFDEISRGALRFADDELQIVGFTGCSDIKIDNGRILYISEGENPYKMMDLAAEELKRKIGDFELRRNKSFPEYMNYLGWCTWNAFYFDVDENKYLTGLKEFKENGVQLGMTLIDDGWLSTDDVMPIGARTLTSFRENKDKFKRGFAKLSEIAKDDYGIKKFMVWHASMGYWAGVKMGKYTSEGVNVSFPDALSNFAQSFNEKIIHFPIKPENAENFYDEFHKYLKASGIDGVKIDVQYVIEGVEETTGGRIKTFNIYQSAKEKSVHENFSDNAVNCMSCSNDMLYRMRHTNAIRSGNDYMPEIKNFSLIASNAYNTFWMYPIAYADWDMFFSNKPESYVEAIARIAGGSSICVSDELSNHDYKLLKELSLEDGRVLRPKEPGRPTLDCLMDDPQKKGNALKIFNKNDCTYILGLFNFNSDSVKMSISPDDVEDIPAGDYVLFGFFNKEIIKIKNNEKISIEINGETADLFTVSPCKNGVAVIGLEEKINPSAAVSEIQVSGLNINVNVISNGKYKLYSDFKPEVLTVNGEKTDYIYKNNIISFLYRN